MGPSGAGGAGVRSRREDGRRDHVLPDRAGPSRARTAWRPTPGSLQGLIRPRNGIVLEPDEAQRLIDKDVRNKDVLFPYLNGEDLNSRPDQSPSRWVINFFDWPLIHSRALHDHAGSVATDYPDCLPSLRRRLNLSEPEKGQIWRLRLEKTVASEVVGFKRRQTPRTLPGPSPGWIGCW